MKRILIISLGSLFSLCVFLFWLAFFSPRPPLTIDAAVLAGDGSTINYCRLPPLDGSAKQANEIAKGNTPGCGYTHFPSPILQACTEPLPPEADDIRGLWIGVSAKSVTLSGLSNAVTERSLPRAASFTITAPIKRQAPTQMIQRAALLFLLATKTIARAPRPR